MKIKVATDFSETLGARFPAEDPNYIGEIKGYSKGTYEEKIALRLYKGSECTIMPENFRNMIIPDDIRGILFLCDYHYNEGKSKLEITDVLGFTSIDSTFSHYCNIPNPASQVVFGRTRETFEEELAKLYKRFDSQEWVNNLYDKL